MPTHFFIRYGYETIVQHLLNDQRVLPRSNSLKKACVRGHLNVVRLLLRHKHDIGESTTLLNLNSLPCSATYDIAQKAALNGDIAIVVDLLLYQASFDEATHNNDDIHNNDDSVNTQPSQLPSQHIYDNISLDLVVKSPFYIQLKDDPIIPSNIKHQIKFNTAWKLTLGDLRTSKIYDTQSFPYLYELPASFYSKVYELLPK